MKFSPYKKTDEVEIQQLFIGVFSDSEGQSEGALIGNLVLDLMRKTEPKDIFGFVARGREQLIGCIFFTRLSFDGKIEAFLLSPVAVQTDHQGRGVGQKLITFGIEHLKEKKVSIVFTYGDPGFYSKVGFQPITEDVAKAPLILSQPEGWLCQTLDGSEITPIPGSSSCVSALDRPAFW